MLEKLKFPICCAFSQQLNLEFIFGYNMLTIFMLIQLMVHFLVNLIYDFFLFFRGAS